MACKILDMSKSSDSVCRKLRQKLHIAILNQQPLLGIKQTIHKPFLVKSKSIDDSQPTIAYQNGFILAPVHIVCKDASYFIRMIRMLLMSKFTIQFETTTITVL